MNYNFFFHAILRKPNTKYSIHGHHHQGISKLYTITFNVIYKMSGWFCFSWRKNQPSDNVSQLSSSVTVILWVVKGAEEVCGSLEVCALGVSLLLCGGRAWKGRSSQWESPPLNTSDSRLMSARSGSHHSGYECFSTLDSVYVHKPACRRNILHRKVKLLPCPPRMVPFIEKWNLI